MKNNTLKGVSILLTLWTTMILAAMSPRTVIARGSDPKAGEVRKNPVDGAKMVYIPAGEFNMGDDDNDEIKKWGNPRHTVKLSGYWMYKNLVTVGQYKAFCKATNRQMPPELPTGSANVRGTAYAYVNFNPNWSKEDHPILMVNWNDAMAYAHWAKADLPTEAEWEKAARGADGRKYPWGDTFDARKLWCSKAALFDAGGTHSVGQLGVSPYGCSDMAGNVKQWCKDWYDDDYCQADHGMDPQGPDLGEKRVVRGSAWLCNISNPTLFRTAYRDCFAPSGGLYFGFRCVARASSANP